MMKVEDETIKSNTFFDFNCFVYTIDLIILIIDLNQLKYWKPAKGCFRILYFIFKTAGWIIITWTIGILSNMIPA